MGQTGGGTSTRMVVKWRGKIARNTKSTHGNSADGKKGVILRDKGRWRQKNGAQENIAAKKKNSSEGARIFTVRGGKPPQPTP